MEEIRAGPPLQPEMPEPECFVSVFLSIGETLEGRYTVAHDPVTHDIVLIRADGSKRNFRVYGRTMPEYGDTITLPVDGRLIKARVTVCADKPQVDQSVDAELLELV